MKYLRAEDLADLDVEEQQFPALAVKRAEDLLDVVTRRFYESHSFEDDVEWRKSAVRRAVLAQVAYFVETGETTSEGLNSTPQSISIGRTRVTTVHGNASKSTKHLACEEFYLHLSGTGLLYRGAGQ